MREIFYRHALEYLQPVCAKCGAFFSSPPLGKSLSIIEDYEGLSLVDTSFAPRDSPTPLNKTPAMSPSSIGHGGQYMIPNIHPLTGLRVTFAGERIWVILRESACSNSCNQSKTSRSVAPPNPTVGPFNAKKQRKTGHRANLRRLQPVSAKV